MTRKTQLILFLCAVGAIAIAMGIHESIFNNYLTDTFSLSAEDRGWLELPREFPGFMVVFMAGILCLLPVTWLGGIGSIVFAAGMIGLVLVGAQYQPMVIMMTIASAGMHLTQPVGASIAIGLSNEHNRGRIMGLMGAIGTFGMIIGAGFIWLVFDLETPQYSMGFICAAAAFVIAGVFFVFLHIPHLHQPRTAMVFRKRFKLFYIMEFVFGARKQIFITFGPWVLIKVYGLPASSIAGLIMTAAFIGIVFKPLIGSAIDRFGERRIIIADGLLLALVCVGYGYAGYFTSDSMRYE